MLYRLSLIVTTFCLACTNGSSPPPDLGGLSCGQVVCAPGRVCCIDCNGEGRCGLPGSVCTGAACLAPDAGTDGGPDGFAAGVTCGRMTCPLGQVCCVDCNGEGTCGPPGTPCAGQYCAPPDGSTGGECRGFCRDPGQVCCILPGGNQCVPAGTCVPGR